MWAAVWLNGLFQIAKIGSIVHKTQGTNFQVLAGSASFLMATLQIGKLVQLCRLALVSVLLHINKLFDGSETKSFIWFWHTGGVGGVCALANVLGEEVCKLQKLVQEGNMDKAVQLQRKLIAPNAAVRHYGLLFSIHMHF